MRERREVGIAEASNGLAHQRVGPGAFAVAQLFEHCDQIVETLLRNPRDSVGCGRKLPSCLLAPGFERSIGLKPGYASAAVSPMASIAAPAQLVSMDRLIVHMSPSLSSHPANGMLVARLTADRPW
jgi:hypothetical protein